LTPAGAGQISHHRENFGAGSALIQLFGLQIRDSLVAFLGAEAASEKFLQGLEEGIGGK